MDYLYGKLNKTSQRAEFQGSQGVITVDVDNYNKLIKMLLDINQLNSIIYPTVVTVAKYRYVSSGLKCGPNTISSKETIIFSGLKCGQKVFNIIGG